MLDPGARPYEERPVKPLRRYLATHCKEGGMIEKCKGAFGFCEGASCSRSSLILGVYETHIVSRLAGRLNGLRLARVVVRERDGALHACRQKLAL